jgi:phosphoribosylformimino-5-aminoimidazole carboxamide ribotide isomerase
MLIIPAIDLQNGKCVRLSQGRKDATVVYDDDPVKVAQSFAHAGARMLHVVDLDAAFSNHSFPNRNVLRKIIEAIAIPVQFGGGLRSPDDIRQIIELGVMRAVIGTLAAESPETLKGLVQTFGRDHIAVGIDARDGEVMVRGWEQKGKIRAVELARVVAQAGVDRIIYTCLLYTF